MRNEEFSRTALGTATLRAVHRLLDTGTPILDDPIAIRLLEPDAAERILANRSYFETPMSNALRAHVVLRSRYAEDRLRVAAQRGIRQYILVGAGLDTFAYRQPTWAHALRIVEVDHPATQAAKRARLRAAGLATPNNLEFVAANFEQVTLLDALINGIVAREPSFFSWLGVSMYLTEPAIDSTLQSMTQLATASELVMTFAQPPERDSIAAAASAALSRRVADLGEPFVSFFEPAVLGAKLRQFGFSQIEFLTAESAGALYFQNSSLTAPRRTGVVAAVQ